jgi:23S rRNA pseudouridine2605 synthase
MFEAVGHAVSRLIRIRYGAMVLPRGLQRGAWMELDAQDIAALMRAAGAQWNPPAAAEGAAAWKAWSGQWARPSPRGRAPAPGRVGDEDTRAVGSGCWAA